MAEADTPPITCRVCGQPRELVDAVTVNSQVFAVCATCEAADPTYVRRTGSTARILGFEVQDIRGQLR